MLIDWEVLDEAQDPEDIKKVVEGILVHQLGLDRTMQGYSVREYFSETRRVLLPQLEGVILTFQKRGLIECLLAKVVSGLCVSVSQTGVVFQQPKYQNYMLKKCPAKAMAAANF